MIRRFVRAVVAVVAVLSITATTCTDLMSPEGLVPAGDYRVTQSIVANGLEVPAPAGSQPGCGKLIDARLVIGEDGSVLHTRTIRHVQSGLITSTVQEFRPELQRYTKSVETNLKYRGWYERIHQQVEPT